MWLSRVGIWPLNLHPGASCVGAPPHTRANGIRRRRRVDVRGGKVLCKVVIHRLEQASCRVHALKVQRHNPAGLCQCDGRSRTQLDTARRRRAAGVRQRERSEHLLEFHLHLRPEWSFRLLLAVIDKNRHQPICPFDVNHAVFRLSFAVHTLGPIDDRGS